MITLNNDRLEFSFTEVHPDAKLTVEFQRTLRIPDNDEEYPLPPGRGRFPVRHTEDYTDTLDADTVRKGGVLIPMYQSEALWIRFEGHDVHDRETEYPFAVQIGTGKICAVTGETWTEHLLRNVQNYVVVPGQPWLDGYCVEEGIIRQFVAEPLGQGLTAEEQITGTAEHGGLQIQVFPMKRDAFEKRFPKREREPVCDMWSYPPEPSKESCFLFAMEAEVGLAPGGRMHQEIYRDRFRREEWGTDHHNRCFVHILNSMGWRKVTGEVPPHRPMDASDYVDAGLPWFDYYDDNLTSLKATDTLSKLKSVGELKVKKPASESTENLPVVKLGSSRRRRPVRDGEF